MNVPFLGPVTQDNSDDGRGIWLSGGGDQERPPLPRRTLARWITATTGPNSSPRPRSVLRRDHHWALGALTSRSDRSLVPGSREQRDEAAGFLADLNATASGGTAALGRCRIRFLPVSHPSGTLGSNARPSRKHFGIDLLSWMPCLLTRVISEVVTRRAPRATLPIRATSRVSAELRRNRPEPAPEDPQAGRQSPGATVQHRLHPALRYIEQRLNVHQAGVKCSPSTPMWRP